MFSCRPAQISLLRGCWRDDKCHKAIRDTQCQTTELLSPVLQGLSPGQKHSAEHPSCPAKSSEGLVAKLGDFGAGQTRSNITKYPEMKYSGE